MKPIKVGLYLHKRFFPVSGNQPWYYFPSDASWNLLLCCVRRRTEPLLMIHEQRTSSRFGKISEPHCRQKSWNIHCGNKDRKQNSPLRELYLSIDTSCSFREWLLSQLPWNPVKTTISGPQKFGRINGWPFQWRGFFYKELYGHFARWQKKVVVITRWPYYRGTWWRGFNVTLFFFPSSEHRGFVPLFHVSKIHIIKIFRMAGTTPC